MSVDSISLGSTGLDELVPSRYAVEVGDIEVLVISDGVLPITADSLTQCPHCRAELRTCRQCAHFDTARRFECAQPVPERIADKRARNECALFSLMVTVERDTSAGSVRPDDARRAFGNLFRK